MDVVPDNIPTIDNAFSDRERAEQYLFTCYGYIPPFGTSTEPGMVCGDANWYHVDLNNYAQPGWDLMRKGNNVSSPLFNYWGGRYVGIRNCNVFLENIHKVGDMDSREKNRWIGEVKFIKAFHYFFLLQMYGPVPIVRENLPVNASSEEVAVYRDPVDDVVDYIVQLIDEAAPYLPLKIDNEVSELGRITQPAALAIKAKVLVTAASPLFNGNEAYAQLKDNKGRVLFNQTLDPAKWERAAEACKEAIDICRQAGHELYTFDAIPNLSKESKLVIQTSQVVADKWNKEQIWGRSMGNFVGAYIDLQRASIPRLHSDHSQIAYPFMVPTLKMAEMFYTENGVPINEDITYDFDDRYGLKSLPGDDTYHKRYMQSGVITAKLHLNREPRFYGSMGVDGGMWFGLGRIDENNQWPLKLKLGQMEGGRVGNERYTVTGFYLKKFLNYQTTYSGATFVPKRYDWPIMRLADLYLLYAEALNECKAKPDSEVYEYIDLVRKRAGLEGVEKSWSTYSKYNDKHTTQEGMREIIQQERNIELAFEAHRFWDIRRWGLAIEYFTQPIQGWNIEGADNKDFYQPITIDNINYTFRDILWPIQESELQINPNMVQNPGW